MLKIMFISWKSAEQKNFKTHRIRLKRWSYEQIVQRQDFDELRSHSAQFLLHLRVLYQETDRCNYMKK